MYYLLTKTEFMIQYFLDPEFILLVLFLLLLVSFMIYAVIIWYKKPPDERKRESEEFKKKYEESRLPSTNKEGQVVCPKCNSTQIQLVPRKWSFLSGVMTNKIDRVCLRCKHKF